MKKKMFAVLLVLCILYGLLFPARMARSAAKGLELWYRGVLPTLLPFGIFSNIIIHSGLYDTFFEKLHRFVHPLLPVRPPLVYPLAAGFLFGFPMGSKICADLYRAGKIDAREAEMISCISNNFGPAFLCNYMFASLPPDAAPFPAVLLACYLPPLLLGRILLLQKKSSPFSSVLRKKPASRSQINFKIIDAGIMDGFTTMIKLAGYIMLFAMLADLVQSIPLENPVLKCSSIGLMEITNGIHATALADIPAVEKYILDVGIISFGGFSGLFQTASMLSSTGFRLRTYVIFKCGCALLGMGLILLFSLLFSLLQTT